MTPPPKKSPQKLKKKFLKTTQVFYSNLHHKTDKEIFFLNIQD